MTWGAVAGGAISAAGSIMAAPGDPKSPKFRPYSMTGTLLGDTTFGGTKRNKTLSLTPNATVQGFADANAGLANQYLTGPTPTTPFQQWTTGNLQQSIPGLFGGAMSNSAVDPYAYQRYDQQSGGLGQSSQIGGLGAMGAGFGLLNQGPGQDYQGFVNDRLNLLRQQAAPFEQRAYNSNNQNLFNTGRMGTTGGGIQTEAFARGLGQADLQRQLDAQGMGDQLYQFDQGNRLAQQQLGGQLLATGNNLNLGASSIFGGQLAGATGYNDTVNARAQQRMQNATGLFGFGSQLGQQDLASGTGALQNYLGIADALQNQGFQGAQIGSMRMGQQAAPSSGSPWGSALQGLGGAVSGMDLSGMFNSGSTQLSNYANNMSNHSMQNLNSGFSIPTLSYPGGG